MECILWSENSGVYSVETEAWIVFCRVRTLECTMLRVKRGLFSGEYEVWSVFFRV